MVACKCVCEVKCLGVVVWPKIHLPSNLQKDTKRSWQNEKQGIAKTCHFENSKNHTFLAKKHVNTNFNRTKPMQLLWPRTKLKRSK